MKYPIRQTLGSNHPANRVRELQGHISSRREPILRSEPFTERLCPNRIPRHIPIQGVGRPRFAFGFVAGIRFDEIDGGGGRGCDEFGKVHLEEGGEVAEDIGFRDQAGEIVRFSVDVAVEWVEG